MFGPGTLTMKRNLILRLPPHPAFCSGARRQIAEFARARGIPDALVDSVVGAAGEALANAIEHAGSAAPIEVSVSADAARLIVTVRDAGIGFRADANDVALPSADAERGRGLAIMRRSSDIFSVSALPSGGTEVVVGCNLPRRNGGSAA